MAADSFHVFMDAGIVTSSAVTLFQFRRGNVSFRYGYEWAGTVRGSFKGRLKPGSLTVEGTWKEDSTTPNGTAEFEMARVGDRLLLVGAWRWRNTSEQWTVCVPAP
jgi:hypothetical protein